MAQRLVLKLKASENTSLGELKKFFDTAKEYGLPLTTEIVVDSDVRLSTVLPDKAHIVSGKKVSLKPKTAKQKRVEKQIENHKEEKAEGKDSYVSPEGRKTQPKPKRIKCPSCGFRKPLVTVAGVKVIKPHVIKGEPCEGGGKQPGTNRKSASKGESGDS